MNVGKFVDHLKRHGPSRTAVVYAFGFLRRFLDFEISCVLTVPAGPAARSHIGTPYVTRRVSAWEYEEGIRTLPGSVEEHERTWAFARGDRCFGNFLHGKLIGYTFYTSQPTRHRRGLTLQFPVTFTYSYASFTHPEHRGHGLSSARGLARRREDSAAGTSQDVVWIVSVDNSASRASARLDHPTLLGYVGYLKVRGRFYCFASPGSRRARVMLAADSRSRTT